MVLKSLFAAACIALMAWSGVSTADEYAPHQFLALDLANAVLSPKPLGPPAEFVRFPVEAKAEPAKEGAPANTEQITTPKIHAAHVTPRNRAAHARSEKRLAVTSLGPARRPNPLDAQAFDSAIQVWPCKSGGICNWKR
jgi:hypothetical protein